MEEKNNFTFHIRNNLHQNARNIRVELNILSQINDLGSFVDFLEAEAEPTPPPPPGDSSEVRYSIL